MMMEAKLSQLKEEMFAFYSEHNPTKLTAIEGIVSNHLAMQMKNMLGELEAQANLHTNERRFEFSLKAEFERTIDDAQQTTKQGSTVSILDDAYERVFGAAPQLPEALISTDTDPHLGVVTADEIGTLTIAARSTSKCELDLHLPCQVKWSFQVCMSRNSTHSFYLHFVLNRSLPQASTLRSGHAYGSRVFMTVLLLLLPSLAHQRKAQGRKRMSVRKHY